jgi:DNA repair protein RadD
MPDVFTLPNHLWTPQSRGVAETMFLLGQGKGVCLYSPTGGGKTEQAIQLLKWAEYLGMGGCFYVNRKLLVGQTAARFAAAGLDFGIRAADYEDQYSLNAPFQICSADTERSRVIERKIWPLHPSGIVIVDEAHIQKSDTMRWLLMEHRERGAMVVLLTATPIGLSKWADELVISGRLQEYRDCKALVPAVVKTIEQPDLSKVKRSATGEYILDGQKRKIYTQSIVGNVIDRWKRYNPDARPTMLYAPGKPESVWITEQFTKAGVNWCHVDATDAVVDGERYTLNRTIWDDILARYKAGDIKGLSSRFKLREGIDVPATYHCILATPIGSLASYLQTVGRVLRYSTETPDHVIVTDHGGNYLRHGSPNHDRDWKSWWSLPEHAVSEMQVNNIRDGKTPEPIRCPQCEGERSGGRKCPHCGYEHEKSKRHVLMEDGRMVERDGHLIPPRRVLRKPDTSDLWDKMYWGFRKKKVRKSFAQMYGFFAHEYGYSPPRDLPNMPKNQADWFRHVYTVPNQDLHREVAYQS